MITVSELTGVVTVAGATLAPELFIPIGILNAEAAFFDGNIIGVPASFVRGKLGSGITLGNSYAPRVKDIFNGN